MVCTQCSQTLRKKHFLKVRLMFLMFSYWNSLLETVIDHLYGSLYSKILYFSAGNAAAELWMLDLLKKLLHQISLCRSPGWMVMLVPLWMWHTQIRECLLCKSCDEFKLLRTTRYFNNLKENVLREMMPWRSVYPLQGKLLRSHWTHSQGNFQTISLEHSRNTDSFQTYSLTMQNTYA